MAKKNLLKLSLFAFLLPITILKIARLTGDIFSKDACMYLPQRLCNLPKKNSLSTLNKVMD